MVIAGETGAHRALRKLGKLVESSAPKRATPDAARNVHWRGYAGAPARGCAVQAPGGEIWTADTWLKAVVTTAALTENDRSA